MATGSSTNGHLPRAPRKGRPKTGPQIHVGYGGKHSPPSKASDAGFKRMLLHPTIRLTVDVITAMLLKQPWTVEGPDTRRCEYTMSQIDPWRKHIIRSTLQGFLRDGWRCFEIIYGVIDTPDLGLRQSLCGFKALRKNRTEIVVNEDTGDLIGAENRRAGGAVGEPVFIDKEHTLFINLDEEGFGEYGTPILRVAQQSHDEWQLCNQGAIRYDDKVAGGFTFIQYPQGTTMFSESGGTPTETDNSEIMKYLAESLRAAGWGGVPVQFDEETGNIISPWKVEQIAAAGGLQPSFVTRLKYLDAMMMRAFGLPERSATEGTFGTKAEAEAHADIAILVNEQRHDRITDSINSQVMEPLNNANWRDPGACKIMLGKLDPESRQLFATIFTALMADPLLGERVAQMVDEEAILDKLNIPTKKVASFSEGPDDQ